MKVFHATIGVCVLAAAMVILVPHMFQARAQQSGFLLPIADGTQDSADWENKAGAACNTADCSSEVTESTGTNCDNQSDGNTTYIATSIQNAEQTFKLDISNIPDGSIISSINVVACDRRTQTNASYQTVTCVDGTCTDYGTDILPASGFNASSQLHDVNVTKTASSVLEIGVKNTSNRGIRISKLQANVIYAPAQKPGGGLSYVYEPPVITDIVANKINNIATIDFKTNELSTAQVIYGRDASHVDQYINDATWSTHHTISIPNIDLQQPYVFQVSATNQHNTRALSSLSVLDLAPPVLSEAKIIQLTPTTATISWETNEDASGVLKWGKTTNLSSSIDVGTISKTHTVTLANLAPRTAYRYSVESTDAFGNTSYSNVRSFITLDEQAPSAQTPAAPQDFQYKRDGDTVLLMWKNPSDPNFSFAIVLKSNNEITSVSDGSVIYNGSGESTQVPFSLGQFFAVVSVDRAGRFSDIVTAPAIPVSTTPLSVGSNDSGVKDIQNKLKLLHLLSSSFVSTGSYESNTAQAVEKFQSSIGAKADGALTSVEKALLLDDTDNIPTYTLISVRKRGESGDDIMALQRFLRDFGYIPFDGEPTGYFGPLTESAIREFQTANGLQETGLLDVYTFEKIRSLTQK